MMKYIVLTMSMVAWLATAAAADLFVVAAPVARVYSAPSTTSPVLGQVVRNEICAIAESDWIYVMLPDGRAGWMREMDGRRLTAQQAAAGVTATMTGIPAAGEAAGTAADSALTAGLPPGPEIDYALYEEARRQIIRYLPNYPEARALTVAELALFAGNDEQRAAREQHNCYVLRGDFNQNGKQELAIAGLLAPRPRRNGGYRAFLLVVEERAEGVYTKLFYDQQIELQRGKIENAFLFTGNDGDLNIGFANQSGFMARLLWDGRSYRLDRSVAN